MLNRWVCRLAFVGLFIVSVAAMPGCRSTSHGRLGAGCGGCNDRHEVRALTQSEMPMEQGHNQH